MDSALQISSYEIKGHLLTVTFKDKLEIENNKLRLQLSDRELSTTANYEVVLNKLAGGLGFNLDLNKIDFSCNKSIIDIFVYIDDSTTVRLMKRVPEVKNRAIRYSSTSYQIDGKKVAIPYLTTKNTLSIIYGSKAQVYKSYCEYINDKLTIDDINIHNNNFHITTTQLNFNSIDDIYFVIKKRGTTNDSKVINYQIINANSVSLDLLDRDWNLKSRYDLFLYVRRGRVIEMLRIGINAEPKTHFDIVQTDEGRIILPYVTTKGEIAFLVLDQWSYEFELSTKEIKEMLFDDITIKNKLLKIKLSENNLYEIEDLSKWSLVVKSTKNSEFYEVNLNFYHYNDGILEINVEKTFSELPISKNVKWDFYLRNHNHIDLDAVSVEEAGQEQDDEPKLQIYKLKKQSVWVESRENRHFEPISIDESELIICLSDVNELGVILGDKYAYPNQVYRKINSLINIKNLIFKENIIEFELDEFNAQDIEMARVSVKSRGGKEDWVIEISQETLLSQGGISLNLNEFIEKHQYNKSRWDFQMEIVYNQNIFTGKIGCYNEELLPKHQRYFSPIAASGNMVFVPYLTIYNELSLVINDQLAVSNEMVPAKIALHAFNMKKSIITGTAEVGIDEIEEFDIDSILLKYRGKADENIEYFFPVVNKERKGDKLEVSFKVDLADIKFQPFYWDMFVVVKLGEASYPVKIKNPSKELKSNIDNNIVRYSYTYDDGYFVYPYISAANTLALTFREKPYYESVSYKVKEKLAYYTYKMLKKYFDRKDIWLGYEKFSEGAQDNGYYFFKYCYENNKKKDFYYIIKPDSPDYENVRPMKDKVVKFMSFRYMLLMYAANLLISSESKGHVYDIRIQKGRLKQALNKKKHVFLQHGVTALKRVDYVFKKTKENAVDLFVATSDYEKNIIKKYFGYNDDEIITTGFCRWDVLEDKSGDNKEIFVMPTWRTWMDDLPEEQFIESDYYKNYVGFFNSKELKQLLADNNVKLSFYIHPKFKTYIDNFNVDNGNIKIYQYGEEKVNTLLMKSSMLVTDYSSVAWEMFYQKKPVVFFQFDLDKYNAFQGSYLDMNKELFGDQVITVDQLVHSVKEYINSDFKEKEEFGSLRSKYFKYVDQKNSERTYKAIKKKYKQMKKS